MSTLCKNSCLFLNDNNLTIDKFSVIGIKIELFENVENKMGF